jgi:ketosteroid isomerase-like protein
MLRRQALFTHVFCAFLALSTGQGLAVAQVTLSEPDAKDPALVRAIANHDAASAGPLLTDDLTWTDRTGRLWKKADVLKGLAALHPAESMKPQAYGDVVYFTGTASDGADKIRSVRVWVKQQSAWKLLLAQDTKIVGSKPTAQATVPVGTQCDNPCKKVPYDAPSPEAQAVVASWEALEDAVNHRNADGWAAHVADEFVFNVKEDGNPLTKADRVATIRKQADGNTVTDIGTVIPGTMHVWVFGDTAVMSDQQQPTQGGNPYQAMRIWIKRDDRWQLMYSQQTVIENRGETH